MKIETTVHWDVGSMQWIGQFQDLKACCMLTEAIFQDALSELNLSGLTFSLFSMEANVSHRKERGKLITNMDLRQLV